jgi:hypothetical protein
MRKIVRNLKHLRYIPWGQWPLRYHVSLSGLVVLLVGVMLIILGQQISEQRRLLVAQNLKLHEELGVLLANAPLRSEPDFDQKLPLARNTDAVARDVGRFAQDVGLQVTNLAINPSPATVTQLGHVQFTVSASGPYKATKTWLAELLARYPSLSVVTLTMQRRSNDPSQQDVHLVLVWYVQSE